MNRKLKLTTDSAAAILCTVRVGQKFLFLIFFGSIIFSRITSCVTLIFREDDDSNRRRTIVLNTPCVTAFDSVVVQLCSAAFSLALRFLFLSVLGLGISGLLCGLTGFICHSQQKYLS